MLRKKQNRKWQERPQLYRGRFFYVRQIAQVLLAFFVCAAFVSLVLYFRNSQALAIRKVEVFGDLHHLSKEDVVALSEIKYGKNLFTLDLDLVQKNIMRFNWIKEVQIRREFPATVQISIVERKPQALLLADKLYLVDESGKVFANVMANDPKDFPVITGFTVDEMREYPALARERLNQAISFLHFLSVQDFYKENPVAEIHAEGSLGYTVYTVKQGLEIYYGMGDYKEKQAKLEKFKLSKFFEDKRYQRLDLDTKGRVIARAF